MNSIFSPPIDATETYGTAGDVLLRIGNGGAGQSGLIKALAEGFIATMAGDSFKVSWYNADTTGTLAYLKSGDVDVGLTYIAAAEKQAILEGYVAFRQFAFRDHFLIVGPKSDPANIRGTTDPFTAFQKLYAAATGDSTGSIRFLSRFDKSATNIKESLLWASIGQTPWATPYSQWYHSYIAFPVEALQTAASLQEYTLTDRGTWLTVYPHAYPDDKTAHLNIFLEGQDSAQDRNEQFSDVLLNPCHALISSKVDTVRQQRAKDFVVWLTGPRGQRLIAEFTNGESDVPLYTKAP